MEYPQDSFSRGHMDTEVSFTCSEPPKEAHKVFETYLACVSMGVACAEGAAGPKPQELTESTLGDIFPLRAFLAQFSAPRLGSILKR